MNLQQPPDVGKQLKTLRQRRGLSLRALASLCDLSPNTISLIERGTSSPSVSTLHRLATALHMPITLFFQEEFEPATVVFSPTCQRAKSGNATVMIESLGSGLEGQSLEPFHVVLRPGADSGQEAMVHAGHEFVYCLGGSLEYEVDGVPHAMKAGDSLLFEARLPHHWRNHGDEPAEFLLAFHRAAGESSPVEQHL